ncbi:N-acetylglucosamine-6-phosphate deacetylase [Paenibacillus sp. yr247]|uniref:N-acetylglucosamine-6-phosphate deacetylase n=1 Tax=Paenibacillus sp. yr247 TaxID=1761880 RepID=UPI00088705AB|nr:amidohydrolase family protein [Paenibacillus sp. yr247]SDO56924.1 N-acetylglucosamine-6-phosphate deacetylase [Paenibacillus sp. yr247]
MSKENGSSIIEGIHFETREALRITVEEGRIHRIEPIYSDQSSLLPVIGPGWVDLQINGYGGYDFNTLPLTAEMLVKATTLLWSEGVTTYYPTVITNSDEAIKEAVSVIAKTCFEHRAVGDSIAGIHLEGPFISPEDGARGAHHKDYVKAPDWSLFEEWQEAAGGRIQIITLSPEWPGAAHFIEKCVQQGITVSIGHTSAAPEQIREAVAAGASMSTHLGNGAHLQLPRHPNYIWEQLAQDGLWSCVIADGFHLPESVLKVVLKVKGKKAVLVSDAVSIGGLSPGEYDTHIGSKVVLTPEGKLHLADNPNMLAGSVQMLSHGIKHLVRSGLCSLPEAWKMASIHPAGLMKLPVEHGLALGAPADLILLDWNGDAIQIVKTYKKGAIVFEI